MFNFPTQIPDCDSGNLALLDLLLSSDASICCTMAFPPMGNSNHVVVSVSNDFPSNLKHYAPFHCVACDYSFADWGSLHGHLRDVLWKDIFEFGAGVLNFGSGCRLELIYPHGKYQVTPHSSVCFSASCAAAIVH